MQHQEIVIFESPSGSHEEAKVFVQIDYFLLNFQQTLNKKKKQSNP